MKRRCRTTRTVSAAWVPWVFGLPLAAALAAHPREAGAMPCDSPYAACNGVVTTIALSGAERVDGPLSSATFGSMSGVTVDGQGNVYVGDMVDFDGAVRKISPSGGVTTLAQSFDHITGLASDASGNVYVSDAIRESGSGWMFYAGTISRVTPSGVVSLLADHNDFPQYAYSPTIVAFLFPSVASSAAGEVFFPEQWRGGAVYEWSGAAGVVRIGGQYVSGYVDGPAASSKFSAPRGIAVSASGDVLVADTSNNVIRKISPGGVVSTAVGNAQTASLCGFADGPAADAQMCKPSHLSIDPSGNLFFVDQSGIRMVDTAGVVRTLADGFGPTRVDGPVSTAKFQGVQALAADGQDNLYLIDGYHLRKLALHLSPCAGQADGMACDDGDACTGPDTCQSGVCAGGAQVACDDVSHHRYDSANRLVRSTLPDGSLVDYVYNGHGVLVKTKVQQPGATTSTKLILDESGPLARVLGEIRSDGTQTLYAHGPLGLSAVRSVGAGAAVERAAVVDPLGSVRALIDEATGVVEEERYHEPFGAERLRTGVVEASSSLGFTGEYELPDGNVYLRARTYAPELGRFLQRDTYGGELDRPQSLHRYAYVEGRPLFGVDPTGHQLVPSPGGGTITRPGRSWEVPVAIGGVIVLMTYGPEVLRNVMEGVFGIGIQPSAFEAFLAVAGLNPSTGSDLWHAVNAYLALRREDSSDQWACHWLDVDLPTPAMCNKHGIKTYSHPQAGMLVKKHILHAHAWRGQLVLNNEHWERMVDASFLDMEDVTSWVDRFNSYVIVLAGCSTTAMASKVARQLPAGHIVFGAISGFDTKCTKDNPHSQPISDYGPTKFQGYISKGGGAKAKEFNSYLTLQEIVEVL